MKMVYNPFKADHIYREDTHGLLYKDDPFKGFDRTVARETLNKSVKFY